MIDSLISLKKALVFITGLIGFSITIFLNDGERYSSLVLFLSWLITVVSLSQVLSYDMYPYSLYKVFHIFFLFFLGIAPAMQFKYQAVFWNVSLLSTNDYIFGNLVILCIQFLFIISYRFAWENTTHKIVPIRKSKRDYSISTSKLILGSLIFTFFYVWYRGFNFFALLFRSVENDITVQVSSSLSLIVNSFVRPIPLVSLYFFKKRIGNNRLLELFFVLLALLTAFPTGMARYQFAALYIPIFMLYSSTFRKNINFVLFLSLGLVFIFPMINIFRYVYEGFDFSNVLNINLFSDMLQGHYDSYQNFISIMLLGTVTWGRQLLGVLFFWVPRSVWPMKPIGSGAFFADEFNLSYSNISMNFFGEGYINFGYFGILLFTFFLSFTIKYLDKEYWIVKNNRFIGDFYPFLLGMLFFMLRGDLLSSFAYTIGTIFSIYFVSFYIKSRKSDIKFS